LRGRGAGEELALDVVQETFARLLERPRSCRTDARGSAYPWLSIVASNLLIDCQRRGRVDESARRRLGFTLEMVDDGDLPVPGDEPALSGSLTDALDRLPEPQRTAVLQRVVEERSYPAIARATGASEQTVRACVSRGIRALQTMLS
jgi:RNA polymerase sigma factor (sigma-70 family)